MERAESVLKIQISPAEFRVDVENRSFSGKPVDRRGLLRYKGDRAQWGNRTDRPV